MNNRSLPIVVEQILNAPITQVWDAITRRERMVKWFFEDIPEFEARVGFETRFNVDAGERQFIHQWKILEVKAPLKIVYDWSYDKYPGRGIVTFELFEQGNQTLIRLTNTGLESFPDDLPEFTRESCIGGWNYFIRERLNTYIDQY